MLVQTSPSDDNVSLPPQAETDDAAFCQDVASRRSSRFSWRGLGFAVTMLMGVLACMHLGLAPHASAKSSPSQLFSVVATTANEGLNFIPSQPFLRAGSGGPRSGQVTGAHLPRVPSGRFSPQMQAAANDANSVADLMVAQDMSSPEKNTADVEESHHTHTPQKMKVDVHELLAAWARDAEVKEKQALGNDDSKDALLMRDTQNIIKNIRDGMDKGTAEHVLAFTFGQASQDDILAIASVNLDTVHVNFDLGQMPVVHIRYLVARPYEKQIGAGRELVYAIIDWAKEMGRVVWVDPANPQLSEYYLSLGFQLYHTTFVHHGHQAGDIMPRRHLLLDLL